MSPEPPAPRGPLHVETPLVHVPFLSKGKHNVFLKLETQQLSGSFKMRGIGHACLMARQKIGPDVHIVVASGGNAGLAAAKATQLLGVRYTVFVHSTTEQAILDRLRSLGAEVRIEARWEECNEAAVSLAKEAPNAIYIHPFIGENVVRGHTSVVREIMDQFPGVAAGAGIKATEPDVLCCSIGGGGLLQGIMLGLTEHADRTRSEAKHVLAVCTVGADSFSRSLETEGEFVTLKDAHSKALSLRCEACSPLAVQDARKYAATGSVAGADQSTRGKAGRYLTAVRAPDDYAGAASWQYRRDDPDHTELELGCGAALIPGYQQSILDFIHAKICTEDQSNHRLNVVIVACGGSRVCAADVDRFEQEYGLGSGPIYADGQEL